MDEEGCLWDNVELVVKHADPDQVEKEIRAQVDRAMTMGLKPSHLDSHMGTLFADPRFAERYIKVGIELGIPILAAGGHLTHVARENGDILEAAKALSEVAWAGGLPVLDDIHTDGYGWTTYDKKKAGTIDFLKTLKPGITEFILHCTGAGRHVPVHFHFGPDAQSRPRTDARSRGQEGRRGTGHHPHHVARTEAAARSSEVTGRKDCMNMTKLVVLTIAALLIAPLALAQDAADSAKTFAERLGFPAGSKCVIFHVDDSGMCHDANMGAKDAITNGVASSTSIMFPARPFPR